MIWSKEETLPRGEIEAIQLKKLKETVPYIYERVAPYRRKMDEAGVKPEDIKTLADLTKLPFTYKADFRQLPHGAFCRGQEGAGQVPRQLRDHRKAHGGGIHKE